MIDEMIHAIEIESSDSETFNQNIFRSSNGKPHQTLFEENLIREKDEKADDLANYFEENATKPMMGIQEMPLVIPQEPVNEKRKQKEESLGEIYRKQLKDVHLKKIDHQYKDQTPSTGFNEEKVQSPSAMLNFGEGQDDSLFDIDLFAISPDHKPMEIEMAKNEFEHKEIPLRKSSILSLKNKENRELEKPMSDEYDSDDSQYFLFDENLDILVECYSEEDEFVDINEVQKNPDNYEIIGGNADLGNSLGKVILPKKAAIRVGSAYQCKIPKMKKEKNSARTFCNVWDSSRISHEKVEEYLMRLSALTEIKLANISEEKAVEPLSDNDYDIERALNFCKENLAHIKGSILAQKKRNNAQ